MSKGAGSIGKAIRYATPTARPSLTATWADFDKPRKRVVFAEGGAIFDLHDKKIEGEPKKLHDFNDMKYERVQAPY